MTYIKSVSDAVKKIQNISFQRGEILFRGHANLDWKLKPTLFREYEHFEEAVLFEQMSYTPLLKGGNSPYANSYDPIEHLMCLQHFSVPTRLLDWTSDILIALFFCCFDEMDDNIDSDGQLFLIDKGPYDNYLVNSIDLESFNNPINSDVIDKFYERINQNNTVSIINPLLKNPRMRNQDGCFMFFPFSNFEGKEDFFDLIEFNRGLDKDKDKLNQQNGTFLGKSFLRSTLVDKNSKQNILKELKEKYGIYKESIFLEIEHIESAEEYYKNLHKDSLKRMSDIFEIRKKSSTIAAELLKEFNSLKPDIQKFSGDPVPALAERLFLFINILTPYVELFDNHFRKKITEYVREYKRVNITSTAIKTSLPAQIKPVHELIETTLKNMVKK